MKDHRGRHKKDYIPQTEEERLKLEVATLKRQLYLAQMENDVPIDILKSIPQGAQPALKNADQRGLGYSPTSILQRKSRRCIYGGIACVSCVPYTAQAFVLFANSDEPQRFLTGSDCFCQGELVAKKKILCYTVLKIIAKVGMS